MGAGHSSGSGSSHDTDRRRRRRCGEAAGNPSSTPTSSFGAPSSSSPSVQQQYLRTFTSDELFAMTAGFSRSRRLGEGGFGQVFAGDLLCSSASAAAADKSLPPSSVAVAVKLLEPGSLQGEAEFEAEVRALRGREPNPHVVRLLGICVEGGGRGSGGATATTVFSGQGGGRGVVRAAVLERVEGGESVADALEEKPGGRGSISSLPWAERVAVAAGAAAGLASLHDTPRGGSGGAGGGGGIAHGDVSAMNVLVARRGANANQPVVTTGVLCDLGLSSPAAGPPAAARGRAATRGYEAPEAAPLLERAAAAATASSSSLPPLDPATASATAAHADIYALGVLLIDLLTGTPASGGGGGSSGTAAQRRKAASEAAAAGDLERLSSNMDQRLFLPQSPSRVPLPAHSVAAVAEAAAGCLARDPRQRPSAAAVASYLTKALNAATAVAATTSSVPLQRQNPAAAAAAVAVAPPPPSPTPPASAAASPPLLPGFPGTEAAAAAAPAAAILDLLSAPPPPPLLPAATAPHSALPASFNPFD